MITGDSFLRTKSPRSLSSVESYAITFRCWDEDQLGENPWVGSNQHAPGVGEWDSVGLPGRFCPGGIRSNVFFPS